MSIPTDIPLCPNAHDALRRCLAAAERDTGTNLSLTPSERASTPPLCCCIQANLRGRPGWSVDPAAWDTRTDLSAALSNPAVRRAYTARAIRKTQVAAIVGKDLGWGVVYYRVRNRQQARLYVIPANPLTPARERMRTILRDVSQTANTLTPEQRRAWMAAGAKVPSRLRLTQGRLSGQALFVKLNTVLALAGREMLLWPPEPAKFGPNRAAAVVPSWENGQFRLALKVSGPVVEDLMVFGEAPVGPKRQKLRHPVYLGLLPASAAGLADMTAQYVGRFGEPGPGQKVLIGVQPQVNGWKGRMEVLGEMVPARLVKDRGKLLGLHKLHELHELKELNRLHGLHGLEEARRFQGVGLPRCTRERYRGNTVVIPWNHACGLGGGRAATEAEKGRRESRRRNVEWGKRAGGGGGVAGKQRECHRRALWRGS
jgi:hypothetical protein